MAHPNERLFVLCFQLEFRSLGYFCGGKKIQESQNKAKTNSKINPLITTSPGFEPGLHWWKACALGDVAALVRSHMNGLLPFESTIEQTTETMRPSPKTITATATTTNRITSLRELLHYCYKPPPRRKFFFGTSSLLLLFVLLFQKLRSSQTINS